MQGKNPIPFVHALSQVPKAVVAVAVTTPEGTFVTPL
jgi:hypothetical protein